jgi:hypothetical protein
VIRVPILASFGKLGLSILGLSTLGLSTLELSTLGLLVGFSDRELTSADSFRQVILNKNGVAALDPMCLIQD